MRRWTTLTLLAVLLAMSMGTPAPVAAAGGSSRRVNVTYFSGEVDWASTAIFWFGRIDRLQAGPPGRNYVDVRLAYTAEGLALFANVADYYTWFDTAATTATDLTGWDAIAIYLDTDGDAGSAPQTDDYRFISGLCVNNCGEGTYLRSARGNGSGWDTSWAPEWDAGTYAVWSDGGPNNNSVGMDYGWHTYMYLPWSALGRSGPPGQGEVWGLAVTLYDRDALPPAGAVAPQSWPVAAGGTSPATWGELHFGAASYNLRPVAADGTVTIRRGLGASVVEDAWVGGGGTCGGGHEGNPDSDNHGSDTSLYVENQELIADFPCFSRSYLRFGLDDIPAGKIIISATLTLHHWGGASSSAQPSYIQVFRADDGWEEDTVAWNTGPLAQENLPGTWVQTAISAPTWPYDAYTWDVSKAVGAAYVAGEPVTLALYSADTDFHSSKYLTSSEAGDWNAAGRPTLTVTYGHLTDIPRDHQVFLPLALRGLP